MKDHQTMCKLKNGTIAPYELIMSTLEPLNTLMKPLKDAYQDNLNEVTLYELKRMAVNLSPKFFTLASEKNALSTGLMNKTLSLDGKPIYSMEPDLKNIIDSSIAFIEGEICVIDPMVVTLGDSSEEG